MRTGVSILAGLLVGVLVAIGVLAAFVLVGPDPVGLRPAATPSASPVAITSANSSASAGPSDSGEASAAPPGSAGASGPSSLASDASQTGFRVGQPAPALVVPQLGGGTIDLSKLKGKAVWLNFMQTTCPECVDEFSRMNGFKTRYEKDGLVVIAVDIREEEDVVTAFADRLKATFPIGFDQDGTAQRAWGTYPLPIHFWIDKDGIIRAGALGGIGPDVMATSLAKILPGVTVTP